MKRTALMALLGAMMATRYIVKQQVEMIGKKWLEQVYESEFERPARMTYESCKLDAPHGYFELVKVVTTEECLDFTPRT